MGKSIQKYLYHYRMEKNICSGLSFKQQKEKVSYFISQMCNSQHLHFFLGSGCSLPAVPLMGRTFSDLKQTNVLKEDVLGEYDGDCENIEGYLNWLQNAIIFLGEDSDKGKEYVDAFNITKSKLIASIPLEYLDTENEDIVESIKNYRDFYNTIFLQREFRNLSPINVFTSNYDLFNEVAMEKLGIHYTNGFRGSVIRTFDPSIFRMRLVDDENRYKDKWSTIRKYIKLYKIHGSVDWKYCKQTGDIVQSLSKEDGDVLIYPTVNKHLETQQSPYSELFRELTINLQKKNSTLIIIGYGFPDPHINQLISQALNNEDFTLVVFGDINEEYAKKFYEQNKLKENFHFIGGNIQGNNDGHYFNHVIEYLGNDDSNGL